MISKSPWMSHGIVARYPVMRTPPWRWSCRKLLRGECEGRLCATLSPDICIEAQRSYDECKKSRFTVDLSGARPRHWKSEVLSISFTVPSSPDVAKNFPSAEKATPVICFDGSWVRGGFNDVFGLSGRVTPLLQPTSKTPAKNTDRSRSNR